MQINLTPDYSLLAIMLIFAINYWVVRHFFLKPVNEVLTWREGEIHGADRVYEDSLAKFNRATSDIEARITQAKKDGSRLREERRAEAATVREQLVSKTRQEAEAIVADAQSRISSDQETTKRALAQQSEALARMAAEKILGRRLA